MLIALGLVIAGLAFTVSASAGMGGSLILVPALCALFGAKEGVALAALLLGANNVAKVIVYRRVVPWRAAAMVAIVTALGALVGARLFLAAPERVIQYAVVLSLGLALLADWLGLRDPRHVTPMLLAFGAGATSGFSGTSGPLKGIALRSLGLDRMHLVGAASVVSLVGDATKSAVYIGGNVLPSSGWTFAVLAVPLMPLATYTGRRINQRIGERAYAGLFWAVMAGYAVRLIAA